MRALNLAMLFLLNEELNFKDVVQGRTEQDYSQNWPLRNPSGTATDAMIDLRDQEIVRVEAHQPARSLATLEVWANASRTLSSVLADASTPSSLRCNQKSCGQNTYTNPFSTPVERVISRQIIYKCIPSSTTLVCTKHFNIEDCRRWHREIHQHRIKRALSSAKTSWMVASKTEQATAGWITTKEWVPLVLHPVPSPAPR